MLTNDLLGLLREPDVPAGAVLLEIGDTDPERQRLAAEAGWDYRSVVEGREGRHIVRDLRSLSQIEGQSADGVVLSHLDRSPEPWRVAPHVRRILRAGGWAYVVVPHRQAAKGGFSRDGLAELFGDLRVERCEVATDVVRYQGRKPGQRPPAAEAPAALADTAVRAPRHGGEACPLCGQKTDEVAFTHWLWKVPVLHCPRCPHNFTAETDNVTVDQEGKHFSTNRQRARFYVHSVLRQLPVQRMVDIGVPPDLFLLREVGRHLPEIERFAYDLFPLDTPDGITAVTDLAEVDDIDLTLALHVIEHIPGSQLRPFVERVAASSRWFVFEVPFCKPDDRRGGSSGAPHYQFFNAASFGRLLDGLGGTVHRIVGFGPSRGAALVGYRLPDGMRLANGIILE